MKLLGSTENKITKNKKGKNVPHLEITEVVFVYCKTINNDYQQDSKGLYTFFLNKPFWSLLEADPTNFIVSKTYNSDFQAIEVWFTEQNCQPLE